MDFGHAHMNLLPRNDGTQTYPRDGSVVYVMHEDVGAFLMRWNPKKTNGLYPGVIGMWECIDGGMTWTEHEGMGPSHYCAASAQKLH